MKNRYIIYTLIFSVGILHTNASNACTGITLKSQDGSTIVARTMDWSREEMDNMYVIVPRNYTQSSILPNGKNEGLTFTSKYGYAGLALEEPQYIIDGTNEVGLSAALFYFPRYGEYKKFIASDSANSIADVQLISWILSNFSSIDEVKESINQVRIINADPRIDTVHWRIAEPSGRQVVLEIVDGVAHFHENELGVLTNAPDFQWHITNLNNYVNLTSGTVAPQKLGATILRPFGSGSGMLGLPGDMTPPSRFVRAAFFQSYSLEQETGFDASMQAFHILNTFDVPLAIQFPIDKVPEKMPSATQWTSATDLQHRIIYYHTMYNRQIRSIDLTDIDFATVPFQYKMLDTEKQEPVIKVEINKI